MKDRSIRSECRKGAPVTAVVTSLVLTLALAVVPVVWAERTHLKPGWNLFSPAQDVQVGRQVSQDAEKKLPVIRDSRVDNYLNNLGRKLAAKAPYERYPYQFKLVNDREINAFCLPGGFVYVNRGVVENADNEAQLASVMAHEISHAALRHGTNQASKAYAAQVPLAVLGGMLGSNSVGAVLAQVGAGFATNSILLKYSRDAERQADTLGVQILYDTGYDPRAMAQFFEKLEQSGKSGRMPQWLSSHPSPENRVTLVDDEIQRLGGAPPNYKTDSADFRSFKGMVLALPAPPKGGKAPRSDSSENGRDTHGAATTPSGRYQTYQGDLVRMSYPDNWRAYGEGGSVTFAPEAGIINDNQGNAALAYGIIVNVFDPHTEENGRVSLESATDQLISDLQRSNPAMRVTRRHEGMRVGSDKALSTYLINDSPAGGREYDWLVTVLRPEGLVYFVCVAPQKDFDDYDQTFQNMVSSARFRK